VFAPLVEDVDAVVDLSLGDRRSIPRALLRPTALGTTARFGAAALLQGTALWERPWRTERARALLTGVAAHAIGPLPSIATAGVGLMLATLGHAGGWPIPRGGSQAIADALLADLRAHGGRIRTGELVTSLGQLPPARAVVLDTTAEAAARILGTALPAPLRRALRRFPHGDAAAKVDFVLSGPVPWRDPDVARAGTQHLRLGAQASQRTGVNDARAVTHKLGANRVLRRLIHPALGIGVRVSGGNVAHPSMLSVPGGQIRSPQPIGAEVRSFFIDYRGGHL